MGSHRADVVTKTTISPELEQAVRNILHDELAHMISDVEFRLGRMAELERRILGRLSEDAIVAAEIPDGTIYAEDIVSGRHQITGYTVTANSPGAGSIAWTNVHIVYNGVDYTAADANTSQKYVYVIKPGSGTTVTLTTSNTKPTAATLGVGGALIFTNNGGTPVSVIEESYSSVVADGSVDSGALTSGAVIAGKIASGAIDAPGIFTSGVVDSTAIGGSAVTSGKIATDAVTAGKIADGAVIAGKLADGAVNTSAKIGTGIVAAGNLGVGAVTAPKLSIAQHVLY